MYDNIILNSVAKEKEKLEKPSKLERAIWIAENIAFM